MKISKAMLGIIALAVLVGALYGLNMVRSQQLQQQGELGKKFAQAQTKLRGIQIEPVSARQAELENKLSQATAQLDTVKLMLPIPIGGVGITDQIYNIARANNMEVAEATSSGQADASLAGVPCSVIKVTSRIRGTAPNLIAFITQFNNIFTTGVIESITITEVASTANYSANYSADMKIAIYTERSK